MDSGTLLCSPLLLQLTEHLGEFLVSPDQATAPRFRGLTSSEGSQPQRAVFQKQRPGA